MRLHLFWLDKNWKKRGDCANNYNLIVYMENKTYKVYTNAFYGYYHQEDIEVKKKSDIEDYKEFKKEMSKRGHEVHKNGKYLTIIPNNNYEGYGKGFLFATDIVEGFEDALKLLNMNHFNTWIYSAKFKIV